MINAGGRLVHEAFVLYAFDALEAFELFAEREVVAAGAARHPVAPMAWRRTSGLSQALASPAWACRADGVEADA